LGDVAVEQVEAARVPEFLDLVEQLEDRDGRLGGAPLPQVIAVWIDEGGPVAWSAAQGLGLTGAGVALDGV
jgi:hypothetical protein